MSQLIAITGAAGFVGRRLTLKLIEGGHEVLVLDVIDPEIKGAKFQYFDIGHDLTHLNFDIPKDSIFVHLAAMSTDSHCKMNPISALNVNITGTARIIELVNSCNSSKFIFASSEWVYPEQRDSELQTETDILSLRKLNSLYAMTKLMGENLVRATCNVKNISLRFGIVYGPRTKAGSAPESIAYKISLGEDISVGAKSTSRRFIYVDDLVEGILQSIFVNASEFSSVYNLSGAKLVSLMDIARTAQDIMQNNVKVVDEGALPSIRNPDPSRFSSDFGFEAQTPLSEGLKACIAEMC
jgi:nucleoside-diphosphate-sugar epimerase